MTTRAERLKAFIDATPLTPTIGVDDCGPWVARWIEQETGRRVEFPVYATREEGYALVREVGGLVQFVTPLLHLPETYAPELGDVAVIALSDRDTAVIFATDGIAAVRGERRGVFYLRPKTVLRTWKVP